MFLVLTISIFLLTLLLVAVRRRHFLWPKIEESPDSLPPPTKYVSLFAPDAKTLAEIENHKLHREIAEERDRLLAWASLIQFSELPEQLSAPEKIAPEILEILIDRAVTEESISALVSFVINHQKFNVNSKLIKKFQTVWENAPDSQKTKQLFELAARTDNADLFQSVFVQAEQFVQKDRLPDLASSEIRELAINHFWLLSPNVRMSGAGFWLKQKLADSRREF